MKTAVIHSYNGMGDLIWHLPYIHAVARQTKEKKVVLFSKNHKPNAAEIKLTGKATAGTITAFRFPKNK